MQTGQILESTEFIPEESRDLIRRPSISAGMRLMHRRLSIATADGHLLATPAEVVVYDPVTPRFHRAFERGVRREGDLFIVNHRGSPLVNITVQPNVPSVLWVTRVRVGDALFPTGRLLQAKLGGKEAVLALDGIPTTPDLGRQQSVILMPDEELTTISVSMRKAVDQNGLAALIRIFT